MHIINFWSYQLSQFSISHIFVNEHTEDISEILKKMHCTWIGLGKGGARVDVICGLVSAMLISGLCFL